MASINSAAQAFIRNYLPKTVTRWALAPLGRLRTATWALLCIFSVVIVTLWINWHNSMEAKRIDTVHAIYAALDIKIRTYQAHIDREFQFLDRTANFLRYGLNHHFGGQALIDAFNEQTARSADKARALHIDSNGRIDVAGGSKGDSAVFESMPFFQFHRETHEDIAQIGLLRDGHGLFDDSIFLSRRLYDENAEFSGAMLMTANSRYFMLPQQNTDFGQNGEVSILHESGLFLISQIGQTIRQGIETDFSKVIREMYLSRRNLEALPSPLDGIARYQVLLHTGNYPFIVIAGIEKTEALAAFFEEKEKSKFNLLIITALIVGFAALAAYALETGLYHRQQLINLATRDKLTGLYNRNNFGPNFEKISQQCDKLKKRAIVMFVDLDNFKIVNDTLGHEKGDMLLVTVAGDLSHAFNDCGTVFRFGGDEFLVLALVESDEDIRRFGEKAVAVLERSVELGTNTVNISGSVGISVYPSHGKTIAALLKNADIAMYESKTGGRNQYRIYEDNLGSQLLEKTQIEQALLRALKQHEMFVVYQPIIELQSMRPYSVEALLRWRHSARGIVAPAEFIPLAEKTGFIEELTDFVLNESLKQIGIWRAQGWPNLSVSVNISAQSFNNPDLCFRIKRALLAHRLGGDSLRLEVTESVVLEDDKNTLDNLRALRLLGVAIVVDDFGSGYSSLSYLHRFPIDQIKLDKAFLATLLQSKGDTLVNSLITLGNDLGISIVAEGVETVQQHQHLQQIKCHFGQGYLYSIPVEGSVLPTVLHQLADAEANDSAQVNAGLTRLVGS